MTFLKILADAAANMDGGDALNWVRNFSALTGGGVASLFGWLWFKRIIRHKGDVEDQSANYEKQLADKEEDIAELKRDLREANDRVLRLLQSTERSVALTAAAVQTNKEVVEVAARRQP
jgi:hypothetical protein